MRPVRLSSRRSSDALHLVGMATVLLGAACAAPQKPQELLTLEKLFQNPAVPAAAQASPDQSKIANRYLESARKNWQDNNLEEASLDALMGQIKLKDALARADEADGHRRVAAADTEMGKVQQEQAQLEKDLTAVNTELSLLRQLTETTLEAKKAAASSRIAEAELALKNAEAVRASQYADAQYRAAAESLDRAQKQFQQQDYVAAQVSADLGKTQALEALAAAQPGFSRQQEGLASAAQADALLQEGALIPQLAARQEVMGQVRRIIFSLRADQLFARPKSTELAAKADGPIDNVAGMVKKYPGFHIEVIGYTDSRGRPAELVAVSLARAQAVYAALLARGVDAQRMVVSGQGSAAPVGSNTTVAGRLHNNRVEVVFIYQ